MNHPAHRRALTPPLLLLLALASLFTAMFATRHQWWMAICAVTCGMAAVIYCRSVSGLPHRLASGVPLAALLLGVTLLCLAIPRLGPLAAELRHTIEERTTYRGLPATDDLAVFSPEKVGNDVADIRSGGRGLTLVQGGPLYGQLQIVGVQYVDASDYSQEALKSPTARGYIRSITIDRNRLEKHPVLDIAGRPISVCACEADWVVIVPYKYASRAHEIEQFFIHARNGGSGMEGARQGEARIYHRPPRAEQSVRIKWSQTGQRVPTDDPSVFPSEGGEIRDPIIQVMTPKNSSPLDRSNAVTGTMSGALKVPVRPGQAAAQLGALQSVLTALHLQDNLQHLETPADYRAAKLATIQGYLHQVTGDLMREVFIAVASMLTLALGGLTLFQSEANRRKNRAEEEQR